MRDLERELRAMAVDWPATPDLAAAVRPHLEPRATARRPAVRWRRVAAALVALLLGGVAAVEPARSAVLELLGLKSVRIERREPTATPTPPGADLGLGRPVTQAEAERLADRIVPRPPAALGDPAGIFFASDFGAVTYVYGQGPDVLVMEMPAAVTPFVEKSLGAGARLDRFRIGGDPAYFISGAPHGVAFSQGGDTRFDPQRLAGNTLLLERDDLFLRIEGDLDRERAAEIARSVPD